MRDGSLFNDKKTTQPYYSILFNILLQNLVYVSMLRVKTNIMVWGTGSGLVMMLDPNCYIIGVVPGNLKVSGGWGQVITDPNIDEEIKSSVS